MLPQYLVAECENSYKMDIATIGSHLDVLGSNKAVLRDDQIETQLHLG